MKNKYILLFILILYVFLNYTIEPFGNNMVIDDSNTSINLSSNCDERDKQLCTATSGCKWDNSNYKCSMKQNIMMGFGKKGEHLHVETKCSNRTSNHCETTNGCLWDGNMCIIAPGWKEEKNLFKKIVHFPKKCSERSINYCMIGPNCYLNGGSCFNKPNVNNFERESCRLDRNNLKLGKNVNICRNVRQYWTPEYDEKNDIPIPIQIIDQTKTCRSCLKPI